VQVPTTLLAQIDASVGGKTAVNTKHGKNLLGVFHQPAAVVIDTATLATLPRREMTAGWCEAVKQGAAGDVELFKQTTEFLAQHGPAQSAHPQLAQLIAAQCAFKAGIVAGDEREDATRADARSRRILNFGHTVGHALESVTRYRRFRHGEAVGYGMLAAGELSKRLALLNDVELKCLQEAVRSCGALPRVTDLSAETVIDTLAGDKKSVGGHVKWVLLEQLGTARIVDGREISRQLLRAALREALRLA
jgi:3-dehydroquinate synthase